MREGSNYRFNDKPASSCYHITIVRGGKLRGEEVPADGRLRTAKPFIRVDAYSREIPNAQGDRGKPHSVRRTMQIDEPFQTGGCDSIGNFINSCFSDN